MSKPKILLQFDSDPHASVFDAVVAVDAGVDKLLQYHAVEPVNVRELVHGAMFTRGPQDLRSTAIFVGGANVATGEALLKKIVESFFGPLRVSVMLDANGANTTAAAAVIAAGRHVKLAESTALVLAGTGPVGQRVGRLLAREGASVRIASRTLDRSEAACQAIQTSVPGGKLEAVQTASMQEVVSSLTDVNIVIAAGAAGVELLPAAAAVQANALRVAIDLNAVPPAGIAGIQVMDQGIDRNGVLCYGAIGVGGTKMKIHKAAIARLFESNSQVLDAEEIYQLGCELGL